METPDTTSSAETLSRKPDAVEAAAKSVQNDSSVINAKVNRKNFMDALENGTLACLPGTDGKADVSDVKNVVNGTKYKGITTLLLKNFSKLNGFPTNEYMTVQQLDKVNMEKELGWNDRLKIKKGSHGINIEFSVPKRDEKGNEVKDPETGKTVNEKITAKLFNIAQVENSEKLIEWAKEQAQKRYEYAKAQAGDKWHEANPEKIRVVVNAISSNPAQYLAEYFDAMEMGKDFTASKEIVDDFKKKTKEFIWEHKEGEERKPHINPYNLNRLGYEVNKKLHEMRQARAIELGYEVNEKLHEMKQARATEIRQAYGQKKYEGKLEKAKEYHKARNASFRSMSDDDGMSMSD